MNAGPGGLDKRGPTALPNYIQLPTIVGIYR